MRTRACRSPGSGTGTSLMSSFPFSTRAAFTAASLCEYAVTPSSSPKAVELRASDLNHVDDLALQDLRRIKAWRRGHEDQIINVVEIRSTKLWPAVAELAFENLPGAGLGK